MSPAPQTTMKTTDCTERSWTPVTQVYETTYNVTGQAFPFHVSSAMHRVEFGFSIWSPTPSVFISKRHRIIFELAHPQAPYRDPLAWQSVRMRRSSVCSRPLVIRVLWLRLGGSDLPWARHTYPAGPPEREVMGWWA